MFYYLNIYYMVVTMPQNFLIKCLDHAHNTRKVDCMLYDLVLVKQRHFYFGRLLCPYT